MIPAFFSIYAGQSAGDQFSTWEAVKDFEAIIGQMIGSLRFPTLVIQEGGYDSRVLGINARHFLTGLWSGSYSP